MKFIKIKNKYIQTIFSLFKNNKNTVLTFIFLGVVGDIFFIDSSSDVRTFAILGVSIISMLVYKLWSNLIFKFCLLLLGIMFFQFVVSFTSEATEKAAVWLFLFLGVGMIRQWIE